MTGTLPALPIGGVGIREGGSVKDEGSSGRGQIVSLVERACAGSDAAYGSLMRHYWPGVYRVVLRMVRAEDVAQDVAQQAFIRGWESIERLREASRFRSWIYAIALNAARNELRKRARPRHVDVDGLPLQAPEFTAEDGQNEHGRWLREAVQELPERQRSVVSLRIEGELSFREIADAIGGTEGAARVNFCHALKTLKARLGERKAQEESHE